MLMLIQAPEGPWCSPLMFLTLEIEAVLVTTGRLTLTQTCSARTIATLTD